MYSPVSNHRRVVAVGFNRVAAVLIAVVSVGSATNVGGTHDGRVDGAQCAVAMARTALAVFSEVANCAVHAAPNIHNTGVRTVLPRA